MQAVNVGNQFFLTGPSTEVETEPLIGAFGGRPSAVAGTWVTPEAAGLARTHQVWQLTNGHAIGPE